MEDNMKKCGHMDWCDCMQIKKLKDYKMRMEELGITPPSIGEIEEKIITTQLEELNKFLIKLANMDKVDIRRKILALKEYINKLVNWK